jgi:hypothetical protein
MFCSIEGAGRHFYISVCYFASRESLLDLAFGA